MNNIISKEYQAPIILIGIALFLIIPVYITKRSDLPAAILVVAACACFFGSVFLLANRPEDGIPSDVASLFSTGMTISYARVAAELGASGSAHFIPDGKTVVQFNPSGNCRNIPKPENTAIVPIPESGGIFSEPAGMPIMNYLCTTKKLRIPHDMSDITAAIAEAERDLIHVADEITMTEEGESVVVTFSGFRFGNACLEVRSESPRICEIAPCPPCSLVGCMLAAGTGEGWKIEGISHSPEKSEMIVTFIRTQDGHPPKGGDPDTTR